MSNGHAAYYVYLARVDRERAEVLRRFGYHASANYIERRAVRHEQAAKTAGAGILADPAPLVPPPTPPEN